MYRCALSRLAVPTSRRHSGNGGAPSTWGLYPGPDWFANDPFLSADKLSVKYVYISSGSGFGSKYDGSVNVGDPSFDALRYVQRVPLEVGASASNRVYIERLKAFPMHLTTVVTPDGDHWWDYWRDNFKHSWRSTFRPAFF